VEVEEMMTRRVVHDLGCVCGRHFRRALYHSLTVAEHPGLRYGVLAGVLNAAQCPSCERVARVNLPFLYQDNARDHLIYVYPLDTDEDNGEGERDGRGEPRGQTAQMELVGAFDPSIPGIEDLPRPTVLFGLERLADIIADELTPDEQPGSIAFDVRPGLRSERTARLVANRLAGQTDGYVYAWRDGGRLHLQVLGPSGRLQELIGDDE